MEGFEVSDGHSNSILVSEWCGALCYVVSTNPSINVEVTFDE